jgi:hypothetical protein
MARQDRIGWTHYKCGKPEHRGGFPDRFEIAFTNLTRVEAGEVLELLAAMQTRREPAKEATPTI